MPEFLVETYFSSSASPSGGPLADDIAAAADALTGEGRDVCLASVVVIPDDETCLYLFEAESADAVQQVAARVGLRGHVEAVSARTFPRPERSTARRSEPAPAARDARRGEPPPRTGRCAAGP